MRKLLLIAIFAISTSTLFAQHTNNTGSASKQTGTTVQKANTSVNVAKPATKGGSASGGGGFTANAKPMIKEGSSGGGVAKSATFKRLSTQPTTTKNVTFNKGGTGSTGGRTQTGK